MCGIWAGVLGAKVSPYDDFFDLGGNSLKVIDVVIAAREHGIALRSSAIFRNPTPARLAESLTVGGVAADSASLTSAVPAAWTAVLDDTSPVSDGTGDPAGARFVIPAAPSRAAEPLFLVVSSHFSAAERQAARSWETGRPVYGLAARLDRQVGPQAQTVTEISERLVADMRQVQPHGPYHMAGIGSGAVLAFEAARLLRRRAQRVARIVMIKPTAPGPRDDGGPTDFGDALRSQLAQLARRFGLEPDESAAEMFGRMRAEGWYDDATDAAALPRLLRASAAVTAALSRYRPGSYDGSVVLLHDEMDAEAAERTWAKVAADRTVHWFSYGLDWFGPLLRDPRVAEIMKKELFP